ncbi:MAG: peroxidase [Acidobacteria bacterium]|nr:peroxidase [Acidobacteriota bacterium]
MFLHQVEDGPGRGVYAKMIEMMRGSGAMPQIFHLFAFKPEVTDYLSQFTQAVMRGPSPLSAGIRELIAAFTSKQNHCPF